MFFLALNNLGSLTAFVSMAGVNNSGAGPVHICELNWAMAADALSPKGTKPFAGAVTAKLHILFRSFSAHSWLLKILW